MSAAITCYYCKRSHVIYNGKQFLQLSVQDRISTVRLLNVCNKCPKQHGNKPYFIRARGCRICKANHNTTLLHVSTPAIPESRVNEQNENEQVTWTTCLVTEPTQVLLATAQVKIKNNFEKWQVCRALLDSTSQSNFITAELQKRLHSKLIM